MTTARTEQAAPASSTSFSDKVKSSLSGLFTLFAKADPDTAYRERLCAAEREMFDCFQQFRESYPRHTVFVGISESCCPDRYASFATVDQARVAVDEMSRTRCGPKAFVVLNLKENFRDQWSQKPDGSDVLSVVKANPISRFPSITLSSPRQDKSFRYANS